MNLPQKMSADDQARALEILGYGSAAKVLGNPYPLGGYYGIEIGLSTEYIPVEDLSGLGSGAAENKEYNYYTLSFAKGLYYNVDMILYFTPFIQNEDFQSYGGTLRWGFYETQFFPLMFSAQLHGSGSNFSNLLNVKTIGADLLATVNIDNVAVYVGLGTVRATGKFIGGPDGVTADGNTSEQDIQTGRSLFGINIAISKMFFAVEVDRYKDTTYGGKLGLRF